MLVCVALGGNALLRRGEAMTVENQRANAARAATALAELAKTAHLAIVHGNGPQVGLLALQNAAYEAVAAYPLDVLGAESEGMIGYLIEQELANAFGPAARLATLLTQVEVDPADPAFGKPSKPIGPVYNEAVAKKFAQDLGWAVAPDGDKWRRVVASPRPQRIRSIETLRLLIEAGVTVICAGGGGIPAIRGADGKLHGIEAVIDKDLTAALLARELKADALMMLTDVAVVFEGFGTPAQRAIRSADAASLRQLNFAAGSMAPKIEAAMEFATRTGHPAFIGRLEDAARLISGDAGTRIDAAGGGISYR
jgi:carbamate kinase